MSTVKVSVVVPVYNPGSAIDACIDSLLGQSMPPPDLEIVFVDDGSTDDTPARLRTLAAEHPHVSVITIPNSGWPGRPRNVGVAAARGEYVQFVDQDDHLAPRALERLYAMGRRNGSDIVLGKVASNFRGVPHGVFRTDRQRCSLRDAPLFDSLTPHKMFRRSFLEEHSIAFPEGRRRLEDQLFMMKAYVAADVVSILGSHTCYYYWRRPDGRNAGSAPIVPAGYYDNLREVLDVVVAGTEPGEARDRIIRRFYRVEMLGRVSEPAVLTYHPDLLDQMCDALRPLVRDFVTPGVHDGLGPVQRARSALLQADDRSGLVALAEAARSVRPGVRLHTFDWDSDGRAVVTLSARLVQGASGGALPLLVRHGRVLMDAGLGDPRRPGASLVEVGADLTAFSAEVAVRNRESEVEWACPTSVHASVRPLDGGLHEVVLRCSAVVDTGRVGPRGRLARGMWDVWVLVRGLGLVRKVRLGADRDDEVAARCLPALLGSPARPVVPYFTHPHGNLTLDVDRRAKRLGPALSGRPLRRTPGRRPEILLDLATSASTSRSTAELVLRRPGPGGVVVEATVPAVLRPVGGRVHLRVRSRSALDPGPADVGVRLDGHEGPDVPLGRVVVGRTGHLRLPLDLPTTPVRWQARFAGLRGQARSGSRRVVRAVRREVRRRRAALLG